MTRVSKVTLLLAALLAPLNASPFVSTTSQGLWPSYWPSELEPFRDDAQTADYGTGLDNGTMYQITFTSREEFEAIWPVLLEVKSEGAPIEIRPGGWTFQYFGDNQWDASQPRVRITAPPLGVAGQPPMRDEAGNVISSERVRLLWLSKGHQGLTEEELANLDEDSIEGELRRDPELIEEHRGNGWFLEYGPDWPDHIRDENGYLPECVHAVGEPGALEWAAGERDVGGCIQCRIQLQLIVDGDIIDLTRIEFPADTPIVDKRAIKDPPPRIAAE